MAEPTPTDAVCTERLYVVRGRTHILADVSCRIPAGICAAILGPNGSGKTTFTRALTAQTFVSSGTVTVLGETIGHTDVRALRKRIGVVNPTAGYVHGATVDDELTAHEAVMTGFFGTVGLYEQPDAAQTERAMRLLEQVGLGSRRDLPFALLSSGEQRRCLIARALAHRPRLLILDEPTAELDVAGREQVLATIEMILAMPEPPTVLLITHHVEELSPRTSLVLLLKQGRLVAEGPPQQVLTAENLSALYGCEVEVQQTGGRYYLHVHPHAWRALIEE